MTKEKTRVMTQDRNINKQKRCRLTYTIINRCLLGVILFVGVYYLTIINDLTVKGFELQKLKSQVSEMSEQNTKLEQESVYLKSSASIDKRIDDLNMVAVSDFAYIESSPDFVAKR